MSKIKFKRSSVTGKIPLTSDLDFGEVALNYADGIISYKRSDNTIQTLGSLQSTPLHISDTTNTTGSDSGAFTVAGGAGIGIDLAVGETLYVGPGATTTAFPNPAFIARRGAVDYIQAALINSNPNGSADWVAYASNGNTDHGWIDMGMTGSTFSDPAYTITGEGDGYIFSSGVNDSYSHGNLVLATDSTGITNDIVFATGGFLSANEKMRFSDADSQLYIKTTTAASDQATGALRVAGGVGVGGDLYAGNIYSNGTLLTVGGASVGIQYAGSSLGTASTLNFSTGTTATISGGVVTIQATGGGGSFSTSTLVAQAVTATYASYAFSFNTSTLVTQAVSATTATNAAFAYSFNTSTLVANAVSASTATNAAFAYSFNTSTLVANAVSATTATNAAVAYSWLGGTVVNPVTFNSNVTFSGSATYVSSTNTVYTDNLIELHTPPGGVDSNWTSNDGKDIGFRFHYYGSGADQNAALVLAQDTGALEWYSSGTEIGNVFSGTYGTIKAGSIQLISTSTINGSKILSAADLQTVTTTATFITNDPTSQTGLAAIAGTSTTYGSYQFGDVNSVSTFNDYNTATNTGFYSINDAATQPGYVVYVGWTNVTKFTRFVLNINYTASSGHTIDIDLYNFTTAGWDTFTTYSGTQNWFQFILEVIDTTAYISAGKVYARLYHVNTGNASLPHNTKIDYIALQDSLQGGQGPRGATGATGATGPQGLTTSTTSTFIFFDTTQSTSTTTGAVTVAGGVGIAKNLFVGGVVTATNLYIGSYAVSTATTFNGGTITNPLIVNNTTTSISTTTGALQVAGGVGVGGNVYTAGRVGYVNTANTSVVYQYYNTLTNSLDTVFG